MSSISMRVELVTHNSPGTVSGIGRFVRELHRYLAPRIDVRILPDIPPPLASRLGILQHFPVGVRDHQPGALLHFTQIFGSAQMLWRPLRPAVATVHDLGVLVCPEDELLFDPIGRRVLDIQFAGLRKMDFLVADSEYTRSTVIEKLHFPESRTTVVYPGVDQTFRPTPKADARSIVAERYGVDFSVREFSLLYVGTELPRKNLEILLNALSIMKKQGKSVQLLKVGGAGGQKWREQFNRKVQDLHLAADVLQLGYVEETDLPLIYSAADLFVTTSLLEGFGFPVLEALSCGTPVVCSKIGSLPEIVGHSALLIDPRNPNEVAEGIASILAHPSSWQTRIEEKTLDFEKYNWNATADAMLKVYEKVL